MAFQNKDNKYPVPADFAAASHMTEADYVAACRQANNDPASFWQAEAQRCIDWHTPFHSVCNSHFNSKDVQIRWFEDGQLNACYNCVDRHLEYHRDRTAFIWEADEPGHSREISYGQLHNEVCRAANALKALGINKGDVVCIYMPMIPAAAVSMLACARIGAVHSVVFGGFSPDALASRINDCGAKLVITADEGVRGGKHIPLKRNVDAALTKLDQSTVSHVLVVRHTNAEIPWNSQRDQDYQQALDSADSDCPIEVMNAEDPFFILYTSGSTGTPKGVLHTTGGYMVWAAYTFRLVFDYRPDDIYWCTADVGWITGHSYLLYGPLANCATSVMMEGVPNYPTKNRLCQIVDRHQVSILYTAPTIIRSLMAVGAAATNGTERSSLRLLGSVGEPINPEAWKWYSSEIGNNGCPIVDTWWQTETGGILISPLPGATATKPGSATFPLPGIQPELVDPNGSIQKGMGAGSLVLAASWPGQARTIYGDHQRFIDTYFSTFDGYYFSGDGARRDEDGYLWITGRIDDVLNVSGHRLGTAEIESALVSHQQVAEAAVVGYPHPIKGEGIYAYVTLTVDATESDDLRAELQQCLRSDIGALASADFIQFTSALPKTRSGKIMRRILRKIADNQCDQLGDISTLADPASVQGLIEKRLRRGTRDL